MKFRNLLAMAAATVFVIASSAAFADGDVKKGSKVFKSARPAILSKRTASTRSALIFTAYSAARRALQRALNSPRP